MHLRGLLLAGIAAFAMTSAALATDMLDDPGPGVVMADDPGGNWDGLYLGAFGGWGQGFADHTNGGGASPCAGQGIPAGSDGCDLLLSGSFLGAVAGVNFTLVEGIVAGIAGDVAITGLFGTDDFGAPIGDSDNSVLWEGSIRGVLGFDGGTFMPYVTAGLAVAQGSHYSDFAAAFLPVATATAMHMGGTVGAGVQIAVTDTFALDLQYRASVYDEQEYDHGGATNPIYSLVTHRATAGINAGF